MRGSWRASRNPNEPTPERGRPRCPRWLDKYAKHAWEHLIPQLDAMGVLTKIDGHIVTLYCQLWSRWRKAEEFIRDRGEYHIVRDRHGGVAGLKPFPQVRIANNLAEQLVRIGRELGLSPAARSRLMAHDAEPEIAPDADDFFARRARREREAGGA